jgi:hypothetical protein
VKKNAAARSICTLLLGTLLLAAAAGCTTIDSHVRVEGWPELKVVEHEVAFGEMRKQCKPYSGPLMSPLGCILFYLDAGEAHIYVARRLNFRTVVAHERLHAAGYDHPGSTQMKDILEKWQAGKLALSQLQ